MLALVPQTVGGGAPHIVAVLVVHPADVAGAVKACFRGGTAPDVGRTHILLSFLVDGCELLIRQGFCRDLIVDARCAGAIRATGRQASIKKVGSAAQGVLKDLVPFPLVVIQFFPNDHFQATIAYDIKWSERPIYVGIDSFGIGWIAADSSSHQLATKTASAVGEVSYCYASTGNSAGLSSSVDMDTSQSGGVVGTPVIINHQNTSTYGKHISGTVGVGTQSNSSNMETIQIFVAYAHSTVSVTFSADVALQWKQVGMSINFTPQKKTTIIARGNATFKYNGQGYQTAGTV